MTMRGYVPATELFARTPRPSRVAPAVSLPLTQRQKQCVRRFVVWGWSIARIARDLGLDDRTVRDHLDRAARKVWTYRSLTA